jgi:hypothetical protein
MAPPPPPGMARAAARAAAAAAAHAAPPPPPPPPALLAIPEPDAAAAAMLGEMGFEPPLVRKALLLHRNDMDVRPRPPLTLPCLSHPPASHIL